MYLCTVDIFVGEYSVKKFSNIPINITLVVYWLESYVHIQLLNAFPVMFTC